MDESADALVKEARALAGAATSGAWRVDSMEEFGVNWPIGTIMNLGGDKGPDGCLYSRYVVATDGINASQLRSNGARADAAFIAASRTLVPQLCDLVDAQAAEIERLRGAQRDIGILLANLDWLQECFDADLEADDAAIVDQIRATWLPAWEKCETCNGYGNHPADGGSYPCPDCKGSGSSQQGGGDE